ncbi:MAG: hypothetical protein RDV41_10720 [Planctomycetota bacterium]|nr:hypothetical protein [Planctomycetota bacterium]
MTDPELSELLLKEKLVTEEQLKKAKDFQQKVGGPLSAILQKLGYITEKALTDLVAKQEGLEVVDLEGMVIPENLVKRIPRKIIEDHEVIPVAFKDNVLTLATSDADAFAAIEQIQLVTGYKVEIALAPRESIKKAINDLFYAEGEAKASQSRDDLMRELEESDEEPETRLHDRPGKDRQEEKEDEEPEGGGEKKSQKRKWKEEEDEPDMGEREEKPDYERLQKALIPLLIKKGVITERELIEEEKRL